MKLQPVLTLPLGQPVGQLRATPVRLGGKGPPAILAAYGADFDVDPYHEMFFFPTDTLKLILFTTEGEVLWKKDLGRGVVPGMWFCPVFPFDIDGDGVEEIWFVNNTSTQHPLSLDSYRLTRLDARTGEQTGEWDWQRSAGGESISHMFRNFIIGGSVRGEPVLVTATGTYGKMLLRGWRPDMTPRWERPIAKDEPGARGSHMCPITDLDGNGAEELMWGERCISLDDGREIFCADRDLYSGHSDVIAPMLDHASGRWFIYTIREGDGEVSPRVALFDDKGARVWGAVDRGHMDMGWVARLNDDASHVAMAIRIGQKTCGPDGRFHQDRTEFVFDARTGHPRELPYSIYGTIPVDLDGDGLHELVHGLSGQDGTVRMRGGEVVGKIAGTVAIASKLTAHAGEQILDYAPDGTVRIWADLDARDSEAALARYAHPFYQASQRLGITGSNLSVLGGI